MIYDGVWVGEKSSIANVHGIRKELVEKLKAIKAPVIRWPGGCFADSYDWKDGIGPRDKRPRRTNFWVDDPQAKKLSANAVQKFEPNTFGTDEFVEFCKLSSAEPYIAANLRALPPLSFDQWVEYCNSPAHSTTYADVRAAAGYAEPYNVRYWGIGNESWGCGGNFTPEEYSNEYRRFTAWVPDYGVDLRYVASGPNQDDVDWTTQFFEDILHRRPIRPPYGLVRAQLHKRARSAEFQRSGCLLALLPGNIDRVDHSEHVDRNGCLRSRAPDAHGRRRIRPVVRRRNRSRSHAHLRPADHHARRHRHRVHARHLQPPRGKSLHGKLRAADQLHRLALPCARGQVHRDAELQRLRNVRRPSGSKSRARRILRAVN